MSLSIPAKQINMLKGALIKNLPMENTTNNIPDQTSVLYQVFDTLLEGVQVIDQNWRYVYVNESILNQVKMQKKDLLGSTMMEKFPGIELSPMFTKLRECMIDRKPHTLLNEFRFNDNSIGYFELRMQPVPEGVLILSIDESERINALKEVEISNERFRYVTSATSEAIWDYDLKNDTLFWGEGFRTKFGYDLSKMLNKGESRLIYIHQEDKEKVKNSIIQAIETGEKYWESEYRFQKKNNDYAYVLDKCVIIRDPLGKAIRMVGAILDITDQKMAEIHLKELNEELELKAKKLQISNAELEQFAYVTSHDLQEPLRMVSSFLTQLEKKYNDVLDERGRQYIYYAVDGAKRMRQIILDLLEFSRVGKDEGKIETVDLNIVMSEVIALNRQQIQDSNARIIYTDLPIIKTFPVPIRQVFQNLISNSLKYRREGVVPEIEVRVELNGDFWNFSVTDNGIGINRDYFDKIFQLFQRLHKKEEYSGTGIGLALCKKIIEQLGGSICLDSEEGKGSVFSFTIPVKN